MQRVDDPSNAPTRPAVLPTVSPGFFRRPSVLSGDQGTVVTADFLNDLQEAIVHPILAAGLSLAKGASDRLTLAIQGLAGALVTTHNAIAASEAAAGHARFATSAEVLAQALGNVFLSPLRLKQAFPASFANPGYIQIPTAAGNAKLQFGVVSLNNASTTVTLPVAYTTTHAAVLATANIWPSPGVTGTPASARPTPGNTLTQIDVRNAASATFDVYWYSIGI